MRILFSSGYTLLEIMLVVGLLSISALGFASLSAHLSTSTHYPEAQVSLHSLAGVMREAFRYKRTCEAALVGGINTSGFSLGQITNGRPEVHARLPGILADGTPADDILQSGVQVQHLTITALRIAKGVALGGSRFIAEVELQARVTATGLQLRPVSVGAFYFTTIGNGIASCDTPSEDPVPLCVEMGCTWDAASTPMCQCSPIDLTCPPQQFLTAIDADGNPVCTRLGGGACPPGTYLRGVSLGTSDCVSL